MRGGIGGSGRIGKIGELSHLPCIERVVVCYCN
jgi:hypothetical protein